MGITDKFKNLLGKREPEIDLRTSFDEQDESEFGASDRHDEHKPREANSEQINDIEAATFTANETKPAVKGFKKGAIYGAIGLAVFGSVAAITMHNAGSSNQSTAHKESTSSSTGSGVNGGKVAGPEGLDQYDSYASMGQYQTDKKIEQKELAAKKPGTVHTNGTQAVPQASGNATVRQVPNRVASNTSYGASAPPSGSASSGGNGGIAMVSRDNPYASAIAFALGDGPISSSGSDSGSSDGTTTNIASNSDADYASYTTADRVLLTGTLVPVTLITGIDSSLDGQVAAQVRENVYDSITGTSVLIPAGSRLIGNYSSGDMSAGRISLKFTRIIFPNGNSVALNDALGVDAMGFGGVKDMYTEHSSKAIGASFLTSLFAGIAGTASDGSGSDDRSSGQEGISEAISNVLNTGQEIVKKRLDVEPTATVRPGFEFNVMLNSDLALDPYYE